MGNIKGGKRPNAGRPPTGQKQYSTIQVRVSPALKYQAKKKFGEKLAGMLREFIKKEIKKTKKMENFTEKDLVSFGNFLLSKERQESVSIENQNAVTDADLANWKEKRTKADQ